MYCTNCGKEMPNISEYCKFCGVRKNSIVQDKLENVNGNYLIKQESQENYVPIKGNITVSKNFKTIILTVVILIAVFYAIYKYAESSAQQQKKNDPTTIDYDYQMYEDYTDNWQKDLNDLNNLLDSYDW